MTPNWLKGFTHAHLGPILYHSEPSNVPSSPNQFLGWDFFCRFLQQDGSRSVAALALQFEFSDKFNKIDRSDMLSVPLVAVKIYRPANNYDTAVGAVPTNFSSCENIDVLFKNLILRNNISILYLFIFIFKKEE